MKRKLPEDLASWYNRGTYASYEPAVWRLAMDECRAVLVQWAKNNHVGTYSELIVQVPALDWPNGAFTHKGQQVGELLGFVSVREWLNGGPMLSALVILGGADGGYPGDGFYPLAERLAPVKGDRMALWAEHLRQCLRRAA